MPVAMAVVIFCLIGALTLYAIVGTRRRLRADRSKIEAAVGALGLQYEAKGDTAFREAWSAVPGLPNRGEVRHVCFGEYRGLPVTAFRHRYVVSTGQSTAAVVHWVFSTDTPHWPGMHLRRRSALGRMIGQRSAVTGDDAFDRTWVIKAESEAFAAEVLSARVREFLMHPAPVLARWATARWHFVGGKACLVVRGDVRPQALVPALDHLVGMWVALHPS